MKEWNWLITVIGLHSISGGRVTEIQSSFEVKGATLVVANERAEVIIDDMVPSPQLLEITRLEDDVDAEED
jgi:hypothetical protein